MREVDVSLWQWTAGSSEAPASYPAGISEHTKPKRIEKQILRVQTEVGEVLFPTPRKQYLYCPVLLKSQI